MCYILRRDFYWPQMASNVFSTVHSFQNYIRVRKTNFKYRKPTKGFPEIRQLEFSAMDVLGSLKKTARGSSVNLVMTDGFTKTPKCISIRKTKAAKETAAFVEQ